MAHYILGPTCKKMCNVGKEHVFLSAAFQPTSEDLQRATRRKYPGSAHFSKNNGKRVPSPEVIDSDSDSDIRSSDEEFPDVSEIFKDSRKAKGKGKAIVKGKTIVDSDDDVSMDSDSDVSL